MKHFFIIYIIVITFAFSDQKSYQKEFYKNGQIEKEGWVLNNSKIDYWKFYYKDGNLKKEGLFKDNLETKYWYFYSPNLIKEKEGHFKYGKQEDWWLFYDKNGQVHHKCQLQNNQKNGYCLIYQNGKLIKASKFKDGKKLREWKDFSSFKKENTLSDLR
jgi:antitoxin component YwqK of YwqJK toxin-antitoxin module